MANFSDMLKFLRLEKGLTQDALAEELKLTKSAISNYENNRRSPDYEVLELIADYFNIDMDYLMGRSQIRSAFLLQQEQSPGFREKELTCPIIFNEEPQEPQKDDDPLMVVAAHHSDYNFSEKQLKEIDRFINFVKQQEEQEDK